jgi:hypothetical protein
MRLVMLLRVSLKALRRNMMRTMLTTGVSDLVPPGWSPDYVHVKAWCVAKGGTFDETLLDPIEAH